VVQFSGSTITSTEPTRAGEEWRHNYIVVDFQTTGVDKNDVPLRASYMVVEDDRVVDVDTQLLDWNRVPRPPKPGWLEDRVAASRKYHGIGYDDLQGQGTEPLPVLEQYDELLARVSPVLPLVGHSVFSFELPMLDRLLRSFLKRPGIDRGALPVLDLALIIKAKQLQLEQRPDECGSEFYERVHLTRATGVEFKLKSCLANFRAEVPVPEHDPLFHLFATRALYRAWIA
jgi:DNA polymerase III epsilon subunit-like protein